MTDKKLKVTFAPGCFDTFDGTQEELDAMQKEIMEMFATMTPEEMKAKSRPVDIDELVDGLTEEEAKALMDALDAAEDPENRRLH